MPSIIRATTTSGLQIAPDNSGSLQLQTNGTTTAVTIDTSQNVGIGTSSPAAKLDINGTLNSSGAYTNLGGSGGFNTLNLWGTTGVGIRIANTTSGNSAYLTSESGDKVTMNVGGSGYYTWITGGSERMRIDSSGNVGIGTTSPSTFGKFSIANTITTGSEYQITSIAGGSGAYTSKFKIGAYSANGALGCDISTIVDYTATTGTILTFGTVAGGVANTTQPSERMRIDSSGNVLVGTTSSVRGTPRFQSVSASDVSALFQCGNNSANNIVSWMNTTSGTRYHVAFGDGSSYTERGFISTNGSTTTYSTTSDYRLKDNIIPMVGALDIVNKLKPVTYNWKENGLNGQGFIAHELAEVVPDAVVGEKDAVNEDGLIKPQSIDTSFLVATLTAAIQEQQTIINDLKARVETLETK